MARYNPLDAQADPFRPPEIPTLVSCLHCGEEYDSYLIEWRVLTDADGRPHGFWCCPIDGCDGKGFGFDIFPVDPEFQDERGGWFDDDEDDIDDEDDEDDEFDFEAESEFSAGEEDQNDAAHDGDDDVPW
jgi:hypothetical protein